MGRNLKGKSRPKKHEWEIMMGFAKRLRKHAEAHFSKSTNKNFNRQIAILHLHHAAELFMKAYLKKEGYVIYEVNLKRFRGNAKSRHPVSKYLDKDKTFSFSNILEIVKEKLDLDSNFSNAFGEFNKLRNKIQHLATHIPGDKHEKIREFQKALDLLYQKAFPSAKPRYSHTGAFVPLALGRIRQSRG